MKPNFFIIGAAKCGTNSLHSWLAEHPQVFMSPIKEPNYFCSDFAKFGPIRDLYSYLALYEAAQPCHEVRGEASVNYMISKVAAENIFRFDPQARLVAMIRNPVDVVYAYHAQVVRSPLEDQTDFEVAWSLSQARQRGQHIPKRCMVPALVNYYAIGRLGSQLLRFLSIFPRNQLHIVFLDDLANNPQPVYKKILRFLDIADDGRDSFPRVNENVHFKWEWARRIIASPAVPYLHQRGVRNTGMFRPLYRLAARKESRPPLRKEFRDHLAEIFRQEIILLEHITGRQLSHWLHDARSPQAPNEVPSHAAGGST